MEIESGRNVLN